ncbi:flavodoxin family protein [Clostridium sp. 19966]|uniref:flavodoxin family protein n=1 Tax=Clostridium sp. 19966 TaxID=2768166 RepID=UPI0028DD9F8C|nr:flavodoxin family protein [Clostridium sp. 19966]MDT8719744.1 flavodoxin family protein [Clostridium sp. 19966]
MKVLLVNGSPHVKGCVYTALSEAANALNKEGIDAEIIHIGNQAIHGCIGCGKCAETGKCVFKDDTVNQFIEKAAESDGFIFGVPVYYGSANGSMISFMDRVFFAAHNSGKDIYRLKPAAAVVNARRAGNTATFDEMNKYFTMSEMPVISSTYWNMTHGFTPDDVRQDLEGLQTMRTLGRNMAWFLKLKEAGLKAGVPYPEEEAPVRTHFIR